MCRANAFGGRRCPSDTDPIKRAEKNARRRVAYAAKKGKLVAKETTQPLTTSQKQQFEEDYSMNGPTSRVDPRAHLGLTTVDTNIPKELRLVADAYRPETITGRLDYAKLDEDSYKAFGFTNPMEDETFFNAPKLDSEEVSSFECSAAAAAKGYFMDTRSRNAIRLYSNEDSLFINSCCYIPGYIDSFPDIVLDTPEDIEDDEDWSGEIQYSSEAILNEWEFSSISNSYSKELFFDVTAALDGHLEKNSPRLQRFVYRGVKPEGNPADFEKWLNEDRAIGTEVQFDGYCSTSASAKTGLQFCGYASKNPVMYQILTPAGTNIDAYSENVSESEVLLPRQQRFIVVGQHRNVRNLGGPDKNLTVIQMVAVNSKGEVLDGTNADPVPSTREIFEQGA